MPLKSGKSNKTISTNIKTIMHEWKSDGAIGTSHPKSKKQAVKQAAAIAYDKAGRARKKD